MRDRAQSNPCRHLLAVRYQAVPAELGGVTVVQDVARKVKGWGIAFIDHKRVLDRDGGMWSYRSGEGDDAAKRRRCDVRSVGGRAVLDGERVWIRTKQAQESTC